jgi:hypothetical protein
MFHSSANRLRAWLNGAGDTLGDAAEAGDRDLEGFRTHPHRRELRWERSRRPGSVAARPGHCISPVRSAPDRGDRDAAPR